MKTCPAILEKIPDFGALFPRGDPSPLIKYGVMNVVYGYAYAVRLLHGDYENSCLEFVNTVELLVGADGSLGGKVFELADTAVETAASRVHNYPEISVSTDFSRRVKKDVYKIVKGPKDEYKSYYLLACLSDLHTQYLKATKQIKSKGSKKEEKSTAPKIAMFCEKQPDLNPKLLKVHTKKIEFYLSWAVKYHRTEFQLL